MNFIVKIGIQIVNAIYKLFKYLSVKEKIVYISRQSDETPLDFSLIKQYMEEKYPKYENVILTRTIKRRVLDKGVYAIYMFKMMYHIATSKVVILDTYCIPISVLKQREELIVIQMWHALGAFKKFGYSILDKSEGTKSEFAKIMRMHENYSYVLTSSEFCRPFFAEAFNQDIENVKVMPLPRVDKLLDEQWKKEAISKILNYYPQLKEKKVILYTPTFRKKKNELEQAIHSMLSKIDFTKYEVVIKQHPLSDIKLKDNKGIVDSNFTTQEMLNVADYVVTDYSATMFEAVLLKKPLFFYVFDFEDYVKSRDFYLDVTSMLPGYMSSQADDILKAISEEKYSLDEIENFSYKMITINASSCTQKICEFIVEEINNRRR